MGNDPVAFDPKDFYFKKAKKENFAARSIFKLEEIHKRFCIFEKGDSVLDLGCAPGSWSQFASKQVGKTGSVLGIDLKPVNLTLQNALFLEADIFETEIDEVCQQHGIRLPFNVVVSDMAPKTTGIKITDQMRSLDLCKTALGIASQHLASDGHFVCKIFQGPEEKDFQKTLRKSFSKIEILKPKSTRKESKEIFLIGLGKI